MRKTLSLFSVLVFCGTISVAYSTEMLKQSATMRDPFWPIGFVPKKPLPFVDPRPASEEEQKANIQKAGVDWDAAQKQIVVNGVSSRGNNEFVAIINGEVKLVGESVIVFWGGMRYEWIIGAVKASGAVKLQKQSVN